MQHILSSTGSRFHSFKERFSLQRLNWLEYRSLNTWCESLEIIVGDIEFKHSGYVEEGNKCLFTYHEPNHQDYEPDNETRIYVLLDLMPLQSLEKDDILELGAIKTDV